MIRSFIFGFLFLLAFVSGASAQSCSIPNTLTNGSNADATQVMANFNALLACVNSPSAAQSSAPQGRLTLAANSPVMTPTSCSGSACSNQTTLRYDCYIGGQVPYYNGTNDLIDSVSSCEVPDVMVSAASAGQVVGGQVYDVWWVHGGANRICLAMNSASGGGGGWASDIGGSNTARGTGYTALDNHTRSYLTNANSLTNCFNNATNYGPVSANQATYLGTVYANGNGQVSFVWGSSGVTTQAALFGVYNQYNQQIINTTVNDNTASWVYATNAWRPTDQANAGNANSITAVFGLPSSIFASAQIGAVLGANGSGPGVGIGFDSTTAPVSRAAIQVNGAEFASANTTGTANGLSGLHVVQSLEIANNALSITMFGNYTSMSASLRM